MVDIITRRRLIIFFLALFFVLISVLFFHRVIPSYSNYSPVKPDEIQEINQCYLTEPIDVITLCQKCTSYERRVQSKACLTTGYKETVLCSKSNIQTIRSCQIPISIQRKHFWLFECFTFILAIGAILTVQSRQKTLDKQMVEKIRRQIGENDE